MRVYKDLGSILTIVLGATKSKWMPNLIDGSFPKLQRFLYRPQNTIILIMGTPQKEAPNFEKLPDTGSS